MVCSGGQIDQPEPGYSAPILALQEAISGTNLDRSVSWTKKPIYSRCGPMQITLEMLGLDAGHPDPEPWDLTYLIFYLDHQRSMLPFPRHSGHSCDRL